MQHLFHKFSRIISIKLNLERDILVYKGKTETLKEEENILGLYSGIRGGEKRGTRNFQSITECWKKVNGPKKRKIIFKLSKKVRDENIGWHKTWIGEIKFSFSFIKDLDQFAHIVLLEVAVVLQCMISALKNCLWQVKI